jgi:hypothetical protein
MESDKEIVPYKFPLKGNLFVRYIIFKVLMKPYLNAFFIYYSVLKLKIKKKELIQIKVDIAYDFLKIYLLDY